MLGPTKVTYPGLWGAGAISGFPVSGDISSPFGYRVPFWTPQGLTGDFHSGIDIPAPMGTPIFAPCDFVVTFSGTVQDGTANQASGQGMFGRCADDTGVGFWHMEGLQLDLGHAVRRGDIIGQIGTSGMSTGPHLHFMSMNQGPIPDAQVWFDRSRFTDPMDEFDEHIQEGTIVVVEEPDTLALFLQNSLMALAMNPPADISAALRELGRRVEYLRTLLS